MKQLFIILTFFVFGLKIHGQDNSPKYPVIQKLVNSINSDKNLKKITLSTDEFLEHTPDGGGELVGYFGNNQIRRISVSVGISIGVRTYDYYFDKEKLIFVHEILDGYLYNDSLGVFDFTKTEMNFSGSYYFKNNKLIDSITIGHNRFENDELDIQTVLLNEMNEYLALLKKKLK